MDLENRNLNDVEHLEIQEEDGKYSATILLNKEKLLEIQKQEIDLEERANIKKQRFKKLRELLGRENILYFRKTEKEQTILIEDTDGLTCLELLTLKDIQKIKEKIKNKEHKRKIGYVHIGAVQILIKSTFQKVTNSPIKLVLIDNIITDENDAILGVLDGNLAYTKLKFEIYPNFGTTLDTKRLNEMLTLTYIFYRQFMKKGDKFFLITYSVGYALSNSHHSIEFKNNEKIHLSELFEEIGKINFPKRKEIAYLSRLLSLKYEEENENNKIDKGKEIVKPSKVIESEKSNSNICYELLKLQDQIKNLNNKI